jgi:hypothetical protein
MDSKEKHFAPCSRGTKERLCGDAEMAEATLYGREMGRTIKC